MRTDSVWAWLVVSQRTGADVTFYRRPTKELSAEQRAPILQAYLKKTARATRQHIGLDAEADISEFEAIAARHPIFRIVI